MNNLFRLTTTLALLFFTNAFAFAGGLTVPNTFLPNTPAVASEVNANFDEAETQVSDNDSRITTNSTNIGANSTAIGNKQNRVTASCATGSSIRVVNPDGSVICETDDVGSGPATDLICTGCVGLTDMGANSVDGSKIVNGSIGANKLIPNSVGTIEILNNSLTSDDLAPNSVGASELAANSVGQSELVDILAGGKSISSLSPVDLPIVPQATMVVSQLSMTVPGPGFVILNASAQIRNLNTGGSRITVACTIKKNDSSAVILGTAPWRSSADHQTMVMNQGFTVSSGTSVFRSLCVGAPSPGAANLTQVRITLPQMTAVFVPKIY